MEPAHYTSPTNTAISLSESILIVREDRSSIPTEKESASLAYKVTKDWTLQPAQVQSPPFELPTIPPSTPLIVQHKPIEIRTIPASVLDFVRKAARIPNVRCVVAEQLEDNVIHITTFAAPVSDETHESIYALEAETIRARGDVLFDFHVRDAAEHRTGIPTPAPGQHLFVIWGGIGENQGRAPKAG